MIGDQLALDKAGHGVPGSRGEIITQDQTYRREIKYMAHFDALPIAMEGIPNALTRFIERQHGRQ